MLTVTEAALKHLQAALSQADGLDHACFRFTVSDEDTLGLVVAEPGTDDRTFECDGETVLATPEPLLRHLSERVLDVDGDGQLILVPKSA
jgi:hypothetical protein